MKVPALLRWRALVLLAGLLLAACRRDGETTPAAPTSTATAPAAVVESTPPAAGQIDFITVATDAPSRFGDFENIDEFGNVVGFDPELMASLAAAAGFEYEFVVSSFSGLLDSVAVGEFNVAMSELIIPDEPQEGLAYTTPYLEVGQVLVVRANEKVLLSWADVQAGVPIGVQRFSSGEQTAREVLGLAEPALQLYDTTPQALQALIDNAVEGVIIDSDDAEHFTSTYAQQLKIAGGPGQEAWITRKAYGIALAAGNRPLLERLNEAIAAARDDGTLDRLAAAWLIPQETIAAGESLIGTPADELVIGLAGRLAELDPAALPDLIGWEVMGNTMGGLLMYDADNTLRPVLAADLPLVSADQLEYTFTLRPGLTFPDGRELTAGDVAFSIRRAALRGNFLVNGYLKDANEDGFADDDAVRVVDPLTLTIVLKAPAAYFPSVVATPVYFAISQGCYEESAEPARTCPGIGPYTIVQWEPDVQMRLQANAQWPGPAPAFDKIQLRFYDDPARMRRSLENNAIDVAWTGLPFSDMLDLRSEGELTAWAGPAAFKSYLVFEQSQPPWDDVRLRQAVAYAVDREVLAGQVFGGGRQPLLSPVPADTPGHVEVEPIRDLNQARTLLMAAGFRDDKKLEITIWYVNDGRYTDLEEEYAGLLKEQLEETDLIQVTLEGAPWEVFRPQSLTCNYPAYLLGWPSSGQPASFADAMSWMEYFISDTSDVCSNYESDAMSALLDNALKETNEADRLEIYRQIQLLWAQEFPTLDLLQERRVALSVPQVQGIAFDLLGLMRYDLLTKRE